MIGFTLALGCSHDYAQHAAFLAEQTPPVAVGLQGAARFHVAGTRSPRSEVHVDEGARVIGEFAWVPHEYWPMIVADEPGTYSVGLDLDGDGDDEAVGEVEFREAAGLALDLADVRPDGGYSLQDSIVARRHAWVPLQVVDADGEPLWGTGRLHAGPRTEEIYEGQLSVDAPFESTSGSIRDRPAFPLPEIDEVDALDPGSALDLTLDDDGRLWETVDDDAGGAVVLGPMPVSEIPSPDLAAVDGDPSCGFVLDPTDDLHQVQICLDEACAEVEAGGRTDCAADGLGEDFRDGPQACSTTPIPAAGGVLVAVGLVALRRRRGHSGAWTA